MVSCSRAEPPGERPCSPARATLRRPVRPGRADPRPGAASQDCHYPDLPSAPCPSPPAAAGEPARFEQVTIDELGTPLADVTFVVVDLETTGGSPKDSAITEIGAVKVRGGEVLGEFQTLVDPGCEIPPYISVLTGITSMMVAAAPAHRHRAARVPRVRPRRGPGRAQRAVRPRLPQGGVRRERHRLAGRGLGRHRRPGPPAAHPRRGAQLQAGHPRARTSRATTSPTHRALDDARATVDVLHGLFERLGPARHHLARGADRPDPPGRPRAAAQAAPGRRRARAARASTSSAGRATSRSTSGRRTTCAAGSAATSPPASSAAGSPRWWRCPSGSTRSPARTTSRPPSASCG